MSSPNLHLHALTSISGEQARQAALTHLRDAHCRPVISLACRLRFGRFHESSYLITNLPSDSRGRRDGDDDIDSESHPRSLPWLYAFVDRAARPETELWLFGSWEAATDDPSPAERGEIQRLLRGLMRAIVGLGLPASIHAERVESAAARGDAQGGADTTSQRQRDYVGHARNADVMLWGAVHERTARVLKGMGVLPARFASMEVPYVTFVFDLAALPPLRDLPEGLRWGQLRQEHIGLVRSRTQIPRQDRTLAVLPSVTVFPERAGDAPVAWVFAGLDASLTTLHVEPQYRGRGVAKAVTIKLFGEQMGRYFIDGAERVAHAHVAEGNEASIRVCESLGGKPSWGVCWLRIDLGKA